MASTKRPNFILIVADDLGFSDIGCFGSEIRTPNLDKLGFNGTRLTGFHAAAACSPTRAMIMTGTDHHIAGLGNLIEFTNYTGWSDFKDEEKGEVKYDSKPQRGMPGYEGYLNERVATLPEVLRDGGYHTLMAGKWHLGLTPERSPYARGFNRSFALLPGSSNHFAYQPEKEKKEGLPQFLSTGVIAMHMEDDHYVDVDDLPEDFYTSDTYGDKVVEYLKEWKSTKSEQPFFGYLAFSAPHWPLQAPKRYIDPYRGKYDSGPGILRQQRLAKLAELGLVEKNVEPHPVVSPDEIPEWEEMPDMQKKMSARAMEAYAGMVEGIDVNVGKITDYLESIGELDNTFIMFISDNGAEGAAYEAYPMVRGPLLNHIQKNYDNSLENIGAKDSFVWYGPRWAQAATAPSRMYKLYTTEGGVRVPALIKYPAHGKSIRHDFATVMDIAPTFLEMAGLKHPAPQYKGRQIVPMRGKSMNSWLQGRSEGPHPKDFVQGWEFCGRAGIRKAQWKGVFIPKPQGPEKWQLYDLSKDPGEIHDLAEKEPEKLKELLKHWDDYVEECGVVPLQPELGEYLAATEAQMPENAWLEYEFWKEGALKDREKFFQTPKRFPGKGSA